MQKLHHQDPQLDVRQHISNHHHQSYPRDLQPAGSHQPQSSLSLSPQVQIRWSLALLYAHHSQSEVIIITPFYLLIAQSVRDQIYPFWEVSERPQSQDCVLHLNGCKLPLFFPRDCHFPCNGVWWGRLWFCCQGCQGWRLVLDFNVPRYRWTQRNWKMKGTYPE